MVFRALELKRDQILVLIAKNFKLKYNSTALGFIWSLLVPVCSSIIYYIVFSVFLRFRSPNYQLYLLSGSFLWQFFANVVMMNGHVLLSNTALLKKTSFDHRLLIWATFFSESVHFFLTIPILLVIMICFGVKPDVVTILPNLVICYLLLMYFSLGISYAYAAANIYFRDLERIMGILMQLWMFLTPIFIPADAIPKKYAWIYVVNPMGGIVTVWRDIFYHPGIHPALWWKLAVVSVAVFLAGRWLFHRLHGRFTEMM